MGELLAFGVPLESRHDTSDRSIANATPLHVAYRIDVVRILLRHGADILSCQWDDNLKDQIDDRSDSIHDTVATEGGNNDIMQLLLERRTIGSDNDRRTRGLCGGALGTGSERLS